jgi:6-phosphogluconolactonase (cycloisomerase 2 family)
VIVANYSGGNIAVFGKIMMVALESKQVVQHYEKEVMLKTRGAHVHMVHFFQTESLCCLMI